MVTVLTAKVIKRNRPSAAASRLPCQDSGKAGKDDEEEEDGEYKPRERARSKRTSAAKTARSRSKRRRTRRTVSHASTSVGEVSTFGGPDGRVDDLLHRVVKLEDLMLAQPLVEEDQAASPVPLALCDMSPLSLPMASAEEVALEPWSDSFEMMAMDPLIDIESVGVASCLHECTCEFCHQYPF
jgi:hypothetical protein